ncbi:MAG: adenosylcobinamide-GDP ribazoletransferase [Acidimicrobiales bacterium]
MIRSFLAAVQFLTRIPVNLAAPVAHERVVPWFPTVGALIGLAVGTVAAAAVLLVGVSTAATLAVIVGLLITGAFHEDGLADTADAFGGGWSTKQRLEILKDSRHGTYGVAAMVSTILLRVVTLAALETGALMLAAAVAAHTIGRMAAVLALGMFPPAVDSGLGAETTRDFNPALAAVGLAAGLTIAALAIGWWTLPAVLAALVAMLAVGLLAARKIGGIAGDVLGAIEQVAEGAVLITIVGLARRWNLWWA